MDLLIPEQEHAGAPDAHGWLDDHGDALYAFALSRGLDEADAEDVVQETLLTALKGWSGFRGDATVRTWLTGILRFKIFEHLRRRQGERLDELMPDPTVDMFDERGKWRRGQPKRWSGDPDELAESDEFRRALGRCLQKLPDRTADAFILVEHHGLAAAGLSSLLGVSLNNVHVLLYRARQALRHCLGERWSRRRKG
jgi:RNA polymerase sigma-70 factor (ECF subfamily)